MEAGVLLQETGDKKACEEPHRVLIGFTFNTFNILFYSLFISMVSVEKSIMALILDSL